MPFWIMGHAFVKRGRKACEQDEIRQRPGHEECWGSYHTAMERREALVRAEKGVSKKELRQDGPRGLGSAFGGEQFGGRSRA